MCVFKHQQRTALGPRTVREKHYQSQMQFRFPGRHIKAARSRQHQCWRYVLFKAIPNSRARNVKMIAMLHFPVMCFNLILDIHAKSLKISQGGLLLTKHVSSGRRHFGSG